MPYPFPAAAGSLRPLLEAEGWYLGARADKPSVNERDTCVSFWQRGKHSLLLVETIGKPDQLWRPIADSHALVTTVASRKRKQEEHQGSKKVGGKVLQFPQDARD